MPVQPKGVCVVTGLVFPPVHPGRRHEAPDRLRECVFDVPDPVAVGSPRAPKVRDQLTVGAGDDARSAQPIVRSPSQSSRPRQAPGGIRMVCRSSNEFMA